MEAVMLNRYSLSMFLFTMASWVLLFHVFFLENPTLFHLQSPTGGSRLHRQLQQIDQAKGSRLSPFPRGGIGQEADDYRYYYPGREWLDTAGGPIQAHGGCILYVPQTAKYYWYGENKDGPTYLPHKDALPRVDLIGVSCYSSYDLWSWENEGIVLMAERVNKSHSLYFRNVLERPKVIYNDQTQQYVMWMHIDDANYSKAFAGIAISSSPVGPFRFLASGRPHGFDSRDMTVFKDDDGQAYIVYSSAGNSELHIGVLTDDYLNLRKVTRRILVGQHREAPAVFKDKGLYYMITSGCTGWTSNAALAHFAPSMLGPWKTLGNPCLGGTEELLEATFFSQGAFVLPLPGLQGRFIFMADRWDPRDLRDSRYVWLPLTIEEPDSTQFRDLTLLPRVSIHWYEEWNLLGILNITLQRS